MAGYAGYVARVGTTGKRIDYWYESQKGNLNVGERIILLWILEIL
jgi:hypothetical protein